MSESQADSNPAHALVEEAFELAEAKLAQDEVTDDDVVEVGDALRDACDHPEADIWVTITAHGFANACDHHKYPDGPYSYAPHRTPRETLEHHVNHEIEVSVR